MIFRCVDCGKNYEETEQFLIELGACGCDMICYECAKELEKWLNVQDAKSH